MDISTILKAAQPLRDQGIRHALIGTAALWLRGYGYPVEPKDIDFLVAKTVEGEGLEVRGYNGDSRTTTIDDVQVDYVFMEPRMAFVFAVEPELLQGVLVAPVHEVLELKRLANREQDLSFLAAWAVNNVTNLELLALLEKVLPMAERWADGGGLFDPDHDVVLEARKVLALHQRRP